MKETRPEDVPSGAQILDVREVGEWEAEKVPGSHLLPLPAIRKGQDPHLEKEEEVFLLCASGTRSREAAKILEERGYQTHNIEGGIEAWMRAGLETIAPEGLSLEDRLRYSRQIILPEIGVSGQQKIRESSVLLLGAGGLGSPTAFYLAAAGVGRIGIVDDDIVDETNLQRQILHTTGGVGKAKTASAHERLASLNPGSRIEEYPLRLDRENVIGIVEKYDLVIDGTDNFPTRYLVNDVGQRLQKPVVSASILAWEGQISTYLPGGPCYRCMYPEPPPAEMAPSCGVAGILGTVAGVLGTMSANEALKIITGVGKTLSGRLLLFHALESSWTELRTHHDPDCPTCGPGRGSGELPDYVDWCAR